MTDLPTPEHGKPADAQTRVPMFYSNGTTLVFGVFDFRVLFLNHGPSLAGGEVALRSAIEVGMSPQHMKEFPIAMSERVAQYEQMYGLIPQDPNKGADQEN